MRARLGVTPALLAPFDDVEIAVGRPPSWRRMRGATSSTRSSRPKSRSTGGSAAVRRRSRFARGIQRGDGSTFLSGQADARPVGEYVWRVQPSPARTVPGRKTQRSDLRRRRSRRRRSRRATGRRASRSAGVRTRPFTIPNATLLGCGNTVHVQVHVARNPSVRNLVARPETHPRARGQTGLRIDLPWCPAPGARLAAPPPRGGVRPERPAAPALVVILRSGRIPPPEDSVVGSRIVGLAQLRHWFAGALGRVSSRNEWRAPRSRPATGIRRDARSGDRDVRDGNERL